MSPYLGVEFPGPVSCKPPASASIGAYLSGTGDSRESFAIETPIFIASQADSHESLKFPIRANRLFTRPWTPKKASADVCSVPLSALSIVKRFLGCLLMLSVQIFQK